MKVLGIHDGHTSTACLLDDGKVIANVSEERFTKVKGQGGFPKKSIDYIQNEFGIKGGDIDSIALVGYVKPLTSIAQYNSGRQNIFPKIIRTIPVSPRFLISRFVQYQKSKRLNNPELINGLKECNLAISKLKPMEHHQCHAATAYYFSKFYHAREKTLVITLDGSGDGLSGTVSLVDENAQWKRLKEISTFDSLGMIYGRTTQLLSMKPWEHEYKLMGMAPYANEEYAEKARKVFETYIQLSEDGLDIRNQTKYWGNSLLEKMRHDFKTFRFDSISAGVQSFHENLVKDFIRNWILKTGVRNIAVAGGCFMNIKANKLLMEMDECEDVFVMPGCGDESCALGASVISQLELSSEKNPIQKLEHLYWGPENKEQEIVETLQKYSDKILFEKQEDIELTSARLLADHKIIARVSGRMEWGARSLGNRSILANPSRLENIRDLNIAIKMRDFWMPFAPSILWEMRKDYTQYKKDCDAYLMTMGFDSTELARKHIIAALHPYDLTMRPQFVKKDYNQKYHALISHFKEITCIGGVLNTSFNLHGMPIVNDSEDAIFTLLNSSLDFVTINDYLVWKK